MCVFWDFSGTSGSWSRAVPPAKQLLRPRQGPGLEGGSGVPSACWARRALWSRDVACGDLGGWEHRAGWVTPQLGAGLRPGEARGSSWIAGPSQGLGPDSPWANAAPTLPACRGREASLPHQTRGRQRALPLEGGWVGETVPASPELPWCPSAAPKPHRPSKPSPAPPLPDARPDMLTRPSARLTLTLPLPPERSLEHGTRS